MCNAIYYISLLLAMRDKGALNIKKAKHCVVSGCGVNPHKNARNGQKCLIQGYYASTMQCIVLA